MKLSQYTYYQTGIVKNLLIQRDTPWTTAHAATATRTYASIPQEGKEQDSACCATVAISMNPQNGQKRSKTPQ